MKYEDALRYMHGRLRLGVKLGNERFEALLERLGNPQKRLIGRDGLQPSLDTSASP